MKEFEKLLRDGLKGFQDATQINGILTGTGNTNGTNEGAGNERLQLDDQVSISVPTDDARFVATPAPALGGLNPLWIVGGLGLVAVLAFRR